MNRGPLESAWDVIQHFTDRLGLEYGIEASGEIRCWADDVGEDGDGCCDDLGYLVTIIMRRNGYTYTVEYEHGDPRLASKIAACRALIIVGEVLHESRSCSRFLTGDKAVES